MKKLIVCCFIFSACSKKESNDPCQTWKTYIWYRPYSSTYNCTNYSYNGEMRMCEDDLIKYKPSSGRTVILDENYPYCQTMCTFVKLK